LNKSHDEIWQRSDINQRRELRKAKSAADELLARMKSNQSATTAKHSGTAEPKLGLPEFDGDPMRYLGWVKQWKTYDEDTSITDTEKARLLLQCITGKAKEAIQDIPFSNETYRNTKKKLEKRYGSKPRAIALRRGELRRISGTPIPSQYNADTLRNIMDRLSSQVLCLQDLGVKDESYEEESTNALLQYFPKYMTTRWRQNWEENHIPTLNKDVLTNISKEIRILESEEIARPVKSQEEEKKEKPREGYVPCKTCKSTLHNPRQCRVGTPEERKKYYLDNKKCLKCLFGMHPTETCKQTRNCSICNSPGHSIAVCTPNQIGQVHQ
jgi:hypothetical protein